MNLQFGPNTEQTTHFSTVKLWSLVCKTPVGGNERPILPNRGFMRWRCRYCQDRYARLCSEKMGLYFYLLVMRKSDEPALVENYQINFVTRKLGYLYVYLMKIYHKSYSIRTTDIDADLLVSKIHKSEQIWFCTSNIVALDECIRCFHALIYLDIQLFIYFY